VFLVELVRIFVGFFFHIKFAKFLPLNNQHAIFVLSISVFLFRFFVRVMGVVFFSFRLIHLVVLDVVGVLIIIPFVIKM